MIEELKRNGYGMIAETFYPIMHRMEKDGLVQSEELNVDGKPRKYYSIAKSGISVLEETRSEAFELFKEIKDRARDGV